MRSTSIIDESKHYFGVVLGWFFEGQNGESCNGMMPAKTLKIVILPRENACFKEIAYQTNYIPQTYISDSLYVFEIVDFSGIWRGFGRGFRDAKIVIFGVFCSVLSQRILERNSWAGQRRPKGSEYHWD